MLTITFWEYNMELLKELKSEITNFFFSNIIEIHNRKSALCTLL